MAQDENVLLTRMEQLMDNKFQAFETKINERQRELSQTQIMAIQENLAGADNYVFRKKGHEQQHKVNNKVLSTLKQAEGFVSDVSRAAPSEAAENAKKKISEGIDILQYRQKCIKLADSSSHGWRTVHEYESHPLAADEEDEKKIYKAEMQADRAARRDRRAKSRAFRGRGFYPRGSSVDRYTQGPASVGPLAPPTGFESSRDGYHPYARGTGFRRRPGNCFTCGKPGHWGRDNECPLRVPSADKQSQISTDFISSSVALNFPLLQSGGEYISDSCTVHESTQVSQSVTSENDMSVTPVGRLKAHLAHWQSAEASEYILDVVTNGYKLPFKTMPESVELENNRSARENKDFVSSEISNLLRKGCIREVDSLPMVVNPLTVATNRKGKQRMVLDCRHLNPHLFKYKCCFENHSVARNLFEKGDYLFTFDIKGAYHHIMIFQGHTTFLGFSWVMNGVRRYYEFLVLPFGISTAGFIFTKVLKTCVNKWRKMGIKCILFLDDGLSGANSFELALGTSNFIESDIQNFGFLLAKEKCNWLPCLYAVWLGYEWYMTEGILKVTDDRISRTEAFLSNLIDQVTKGDILVSVRKIACLIGQLISMQSAVGDVVRLRSRALYECVAGRASWSAPVKVSADALSEMLFWKQNLRRFNVSNLSQEAVDTTAYVTVDASVTGFIEYANVFVDASGSGFGGYVSDAQNSEVAGSWLDSEAELSSTWRELESVYRVIQSNVTNLHGHQVKLHTDNKNVSTILKVGSKKPHLQSISRNVNDVCMHNEISLTAEWIPREKNDEADFLSRCSDSDDWSIADFVFQALEAQWGPHTFDRFSCHYNAKCDKFNSRYWCPGTSGIDAFEQCWHFDNNWLVPPPRLVSRCIRKMAVDKAACTLVIPRWTSAPFWPLLYPNEKKADFVKDVVFFQPGKLTRRGRGRNGIFDGRTLMFGFVAIKCEFA